MSDVLVPHLRSVELFTCTLHPGLSSAASPEFSTLLSRVRHDTLRRRTASDSSYCSTSISADVGVEAAEDSPGWRVNNSTLRKCVTSTSDNLSTSAPQICVLLTAADDVSTRQRRDVTPTFIKTDSLRLSRLTILIATFFPVTQ